MSFTFEFELTADEQTRASRAVILRRPVTKGMLVASALIAPLATVAFASGLLERLGDPWFLLLLGWCLPVGAVAGILMGPRSQVKALRRRNRAAAGPHVYRLAGSGLEASSTGTTTTLQWENVVEVFESREFLLFYVSTAWAYLLPKRVVPPESLSGLRTALGQWVGDRAHLAA